MTTEMDSGNLPKAIGGGLVAALVGAMLWAIVTVLSGYQIGFMAIGVGFLVGYAVRTLGNGRSSVFRIVGAAFALLGCLFGNLLSLCGILAKQESAPVMGTIGSILGDPATAFSFMQATFSGMDLLFYGIAVYEGYKLSVVPQVVAPAAGDAAP